MVNDPYAPFEALLAAEPDDTTLLFGLGRKLLGDGLAARAVPHLRRCVSVDPAYSAAWRELGRALEATADLEGAREAYRGALTAAEAKGDLQVAKEVRVFLGRLEGR
jgi:Flp pilus assembly protein TadD